MDETRRGLRWLGRLVMLVGTPYSFIRLLERENSTLHAKIEALENALAEEKIADEGVNEIVRKYQEDDTALRAKVAAQWILEAQIDTLQKLNHGASEEVRSSRKRIRDLEAGVAALEADLTLEYCKVCGGSGQFQDSTEGGIWVACHCWRNRVNELREQLKTLEAENGRLREALEIARKRGHNVDYWLMEARAQQPTPAQDKEQG